ncbi:unnamed protein product [Malus baccata var. baccata]
MGNNHLTGNIPTDIGKLTRLRKLRLFTNKLSGSIPSTLGNLTMLDTLELQGNNLHGDIPSSLGKCQSLLQLDISQNNLNGTIPQQVFELTSLSLSFNLSRNRLTGSLPLEIGKLSSLGKLDFSDNFLSGELPNTLGGCVDLEVLHFQGNFFNGTIPYSLSSLRGIEDLDLSRNNLSGEIPKFLEGFAFLKNLNLSFNQLSGTVPIEGVFKNATATSIVGNNGLCSDIGNLQLPKCKNKGRLSPRLKLIISFVAGFAFLGMVIVLSLLFVRSSRKKGKGAGPSALGNSTFQVSYNALLKATDGFSSTNLIGMGSFGSVYKGVLDDDNGARQLVAVKVFNMLRQGASKSFIAECEAMRNIRHRNLVKVVTACSKYGMGSKIATCGDVYSFGILLLEMFTGKRPTDPMFSDGLNLHNFVKMDLPHRVAEIADSLFDPITSNQSSIISAEKIQVGLSSIFNIGISCSDESPRDRKDMSGVVTELQSIRDLILELNPTPPFQQISKFPQPNSRLYEYDSNNKWIFIATALRRVTYTHKSRPEQTNPTITYPSFRGSRKG